MIQPALLRLISKAGAVLAIGMVALSLAGCVEQGPEFQVARGDIRNAIARGQLTSPRAASVALVSLDGAPADVEARFRQALSAAATNREIALTDPASARYLLRGYLAAYPGETGTTVSYTYDLFDAGDHRRRQRVADTMTVPGSGADPWGSVNAAVLSSLVDRSADDLALMLSGTPEAQAVASTAHGAGTPVAAPAVATTAAVATAAPVN